MCQNSVFLFKICQCKKKLDFILFNTKNKPLQDKKEANILQKLTKGFLSWMIIWWMTLGETQQIIKYALCSTYKCRPYLSSIQSLPPTQVYQRIAKLVSLWTRG